MSLFSLNAVAASGSRFTPASLFSGGEAGLWYDPSDLSTMFTDAGGTTPVANDGDPVGLLQDKSGNGNDATASGSNRPTYRTDGTLHWLEFNKASLQSMVAPQVISGLDDRSLFYAMEPASLAGSSDVNPPFDLTDAASPPTGGDFTPTNESDGVYVRVSGNAFFSFTLSTNTAYRYLVEWIYSAGDRTTNDIKLAIDNSPVTLTTDSSSTIDTAVTTNMTIGRSVRQNDSYMDGNMYGMVLLRRATDQQEKDDMDAYFSGKIGA